MILQRISVDNHLTENEITQYVDVLISERQEQRPEEILEVLELLGTFDNPANH